MLPVSEVVHMMLQNIRRYSGHISTVIVSWNDATGPSDAA